MDEQRRQAEADKLAAITELETKSKQFMTEKKEKQQLEQKIASLQGQMIIGGDGLQVSPAVRYADPATSHACTAAILLCPALVGLTVVYCDHANTFVQKDAAC